MTSLTTLPRYLGGGGHKGAALLFGEVQAAALGVVKLHARLGLIVDSP